MKQEREATITEDDVEEIIAEIESEAASKGGNYAAGMRLARSITEQNLKQILRDQNPPEDESQEGGDDES